MNHLAPESARRLTVLVLFSFVFFPPIVEAAWPPWPEAHQHRQQKDTRHARAWRWRCCCSRTGQHRTHLRHVHRRIVANSINAQVALCRKVGAKNSFSLLSSLFESKFYFFYGCPEISLMSSSSSSSTDTISTCPARKLAHAAPWKRQAAEL